MIKYSKPKIWQRLYKILPLKRLKFWRRFGNPFSFVIKCDYCGLEVLKTNYQFPHYGKQLCIPCYEISKLIKE